jgi:NADH:ubiquinone oxidoreductase subunit K
LLLDPERADLSVAAVFRLALAVVMTRPVSLVVVAVVEIVLVAAISEFVVLGALLPSFGALVAANFVLPVADTLRHGGRRASTAQRSGADDG